MAKKLAHDFTVIDDESYIEIANHSLELTLWRPRTGTDKPLSNLSISNHNDCTGPSYFTEGETGAELVRATARELFILAATILRLRTALLEKVDPQELDIVYNDTSENWDNIVIDA